MPRSLYSHELPVVYCRRCHCWCHMWTVDLGFIVETSCYIFIHRCPSYLHMKMLSPFDLYFLNDSHFSSLLQLPLLPTCLNIVFIFNINVQNNLLVEVAWISELTGGMAFTSWQHLYWCSHKMYVRLIIENDQKELFFSAKYVVHSQAQCLYVHS